MSRRILYSLFWRSVSVQIFISWDSREFSRTWMVASWLPYRALVSSSVCSKDSFCEHTHKKSGHFLFEGLIQEVAQVLYLLRRTPAASHCGLMHISSLACHSFHLGIPSQLITVSSSWGLLFAGLN